MVLLPEGKIINNPDSVKLIKVLPTTVNDETFFVVAIKLDDDSELMVDRCGTRLEAEELANRCCKLLNGEAVDDGEIPSFVGNQDEDSSGWEDSEEESDVPDESNGTEVAVAEDESSSWDISSSEDGGDNTSAAKSAVEEASSSWDLSSSEEHSVGEAQKESTVEEDSSSWDLSSSDDESAETLQSANVSKPEVKKSKTSKVKSVQPKVKPKIQAPYTEEVDAPSDTSVKAESVSIESAVEPLPRVAAFIEDDSDEWIQDNGLDDWYD